MRIYTKTMRFTHTHTHTPAFFPGLPTLAVLKVTNAVWQGLGTRLLTHLVRQFIDRCGIMDRKGKPMWLRTLEGRREGGKKEQGVKRGK